MTPIILHLCDLCSINLQNNQLTSIVGLTVFTELKVRTSQTLSMCSDARFSLVEIVVMIFLDKNSAVILYLVQTVIVVSNPLTIKVPRYKLCTRISLVIWLLVVSVFGHETHVIPENQSCFLLPIPFITACAWCRFECSRKENCMRDNFSCDMFVHLFCWQVLCLTKNNFEHLFGKPVSSVYSRLKASSTTDAEAALNDPILPNLEVLHLA